MITALYFRLRYGSDCPGSFQNETFVTIDSSLYYDLPPARATRMAFGCIRGTRMLKPYYAGVIGGKTGYTMLAGNTLADLCGEKWHEADRCDHKWPSDTLYRYLALLDFGFANFQSVNIADADSTYSSVSNDMTIAGLPAADLQYAYAKDCYVTLPKTADISDAQSAISYELPESSTVGGSGPYFLSVQ